MNGGFEELKSLDANDVYIKTHVSQAVFNNIINKRFDKLKSVQTKGQISVLENAYNLNLSEWLAEYNEYLNTMQPKTQTLDKLALESKEIKTKSFPKVWIFAPLILLLIVVVLFSIKNSVDLDINETNLTSETNETNLSLLLNAPLDSNVTANLDVNVTENTAVTTKQPELNTTVAQAAIAAPVGAIKFELIPKRKLWLGIYYTNEDNKSDFRDDVNTTQLLNSNRPQLIVIGPSFFTIKIGDSTIESNNDGVTRYMYDPSDKKLKFISKQEFEAIRPPKKQ